MLGHLYAPDVDADVVSTIWRATPLSRAKCCPKRLAELIQSRAPALFGSVSDTYVVKAWQVSGALLIKTHLFSGGELLLVGGK